MRWPRPARRDLVDGALAVLLAAVAVAEALLGNRDPGPLGAAVLTDLLLTLPLAVRRRWPLAVLGWAMLVLTVQAALHLPAGIGAFFGALVPVYTVAAHRPRRQALIGLLVPVPVFALDQWLAGQSPWWEDLEFIGGLIAAFWIVGRVVWSRHLLVQRLRAQAEELGRARDAAAGAAIAQERARIARDMHDVVAHGVSVMVVHAEAAEALLGEPGRAAQSLHAIQRTGRAALADLRRIVGVLRDAGEDAQLGPAPGLGDAQALVQRLREAGLEVSLAVLGQPRELPGGADLAAYRVLQEALTNALRHAGPTRATATVTYAGAEVRVDVRDEGPDRARPVRPPSSGGHGLAGARERLALYGGELTAGPDGAGFRVRARIPVADPA
jgi:signal transduction histidine kinase